ncbi:restriction endonuclease [Maridesulfovibrio sp.]|uniref:restriction endonuclease n=1 Tax=Maridesulfovibrio sp. TaxID=2795000 RepID=UPI0029F5BC95|nr:restriction endonuclease [Maridesulfovibrio sp.]
MKLDPDGIVQVAVTGQSGDGGIDGNGIVKIQEVLSLHVVFQCKRYKGSVGSSAACITRFGLKYDRRV